ncbi:ATP-binding cassette domain-containing protein [Candidatus Pollutiaquabacter sp.]|uniref:ATP-binding cassette domain-containing protein n=1 Tax=Candidatus Pollutiaquabacter sp. TaxID=3416354 RepID=UPI003C83C218|nr:ATP-binding cassette domain-containing protein [Bacteroidota bacterium]
MSLKVDASERIAITGYNSSGKSTLINLILGLYDSYSGNIQFNGVSLRELNKASLMNHVGDFVSEEALFDGTILENISIGRKGVTMEDVLWACKAAGLNDFLSGLPEGLNSAWSAGLFGCRKAW